MNDQLEENDTGSAVHCWWRSAAKFDESARMKPEIANLSNISPTLRVLRELERLALVAPEGLEELRHKLFAYRSGDFWLPTGGVKKEDTDIPPVITVLLVGFQNAGKSSLVNLMYSVLGRSGLIPFSQTSSGTASGYKALYMEEHNVLRSMRNGFCVFDTRGFHYERLAESNEELSKWMNRGVHHNQLCLRSGDNILLSKDEEIEIPLSRLLASKYVKRRVNCVMMVANVAEIHKALRASDMNPLEALNQLFHSPILRNCNDNPILILTHGDKLSTEDRIDGRLKICEHLGISETTGVYDTMCLTDYGFATDEFDPVTAYALTEAVYRGLLMSDRGHLPKKNLLDRALLVLSWFVCSVGAFFAFLARILFKLGRRDKLKL
ncbi:hypothetical protein RJ639_014236 [Escallonia herrerae]|uniref:G domain-containing protein n=1 Tax=Escallonia herrerae TaxID=1293975 RepID=A0AA88VIT7_9ASTE|nr:hypothetical protein RJ639_014236 [Escallonia herrerae]